MTDTTSEAVRYSRPQPPEWDSLLGTTAELLKNGTDTETQIGERALALCEVLEDERLDDNRYHAFGYIMCGLAERLRPSSACDEVVQEVANMLACSTKRLNGYCNPMGIQLGEVDYRHTQLPFQRHVYRAETALPPETRLLANALTLAAVRRQHFRASLAPFSSIAAAYCYSPRERYAAENVAREAMSASTSLYKAVLQRRYEALPEDAKKQIRPLDKNHAPTVADVTKTGGAEGLNLQINAKRAAGLRLDEMVTQLGKLLEVDEQGQVTLRRHGLPSSRDLQPSNRPLLHVRRLGCPAMYVEGLTEVVMAILPKAVQLADKQIAQSLPILGAQKPAE
jgi:hypothetical protein